MQQKSQAFYTALLAASAEWRYGLDILASDEQTPLEDITAYDQNAADRLMESTGAITLDVSAKTHRSLTFTLRSTDGRYLPGIAGLPSGGAGSPAATGLIWYNVRFRPWIALRTGFDSLNNPIFDPTYLGIYVLSQPETQVSVYGAQAVLTVLDKSSLLQKPYTITNSTLPTYTSNSVTVGGYAGGTSFDTAMHDLATKAGIPAARQHFSPSSLNLPADYPITEGDEFWTILQDMAASMSHVIYFDGTGNLIRRPNPLSDNGQSIWTFQPGESSIMFAADRKTDLTNTYNHVIVIGASSQSGTLRGEASVQDVNSPYHANRIGDRVVFVGKNGNLNDKTPDPAIGTQAQADLAAQVVLAQHLGQQEVLLISSRNIPSLEPYDRFTATIDQAGVNMDFMISAITWNLAHTGMQITGTRWFNAGG